MAAVMIATTVVSTAASVGMQMSAQSKQQQYQREVQQYQRQVQQQQLERRNQQIENANKSLGANYDALGLRYQQEQAAANQALQKNAIDALRTRERFKVAADEAGVTGPSVEASLRDLYGQEARFNTSVETNLDWRQDGLFQQGIALRNQTESSYANAQQISQFDPLPPVQGVDWAGAAAGLASGVAGAYMSDFKIGASGGNTLFNHSYP
jgi:type II secretory pathway pseudopilin PulG